MTVETSMNGTHRFQARCDKCGAPCKKSRSKTSYVFRSVAEAIADVKKNEWVIKGGRIICPKCKAKL